MGQTVTAVLLAVAVLVAAGLAIALATTRRRLRAGEAEIVELRHRAKQLETDLAVALRPRPAATAAEKAVARVVRTASRTASVVREHGVAGLLASSIEDLQAWASSGREEIATMAAADGTVTLVFTDVEDSTALNDRLGDTAWVRVLRAHEELLRQRVDKYRGQVVKSTGDGFMIAFRDAEAACRAAVGMQRDLRRTVDPRLRPAGPLRIRIGVHTGVVISRDGDYFGTNVAMAARVGALAAGGEVLASDAVHDALDDDAAVRLVEHGTVSLKGLPGQHRIWRVSTSS